jgi:hypothetical protein
MSGDPLELLPAVVSREPTKEPRQTERNKLSRSYWTAVRQERNELRALYPELMHEIDERFRARHDGHAP